MRLRFTLATVTVAALFPLAPAFADTETEDFLEGWVDTIDRSADWDASYASIDSDGDTTTLNGLTVSSENGSLTLTLERLAVSGYTSSPDGAFAADEVTLEGVLLDMGIAKVEIPSAELSDFALPATSRFVWDDPRPFAMIMQAIRPLTEVKIGDGRIDSVVLTQIVDGVTSKVTYDNVRVEDWNGAFIRRTSAGPITSSAPADGALVSVGIESIVSEDADLDAVMNVFDPERYVGGVGDRVWHTAVGRTSYRGLTVYGPGVSMKVGEAALEDLRLRQPASGIEAFLALGNEDETGHNATPPDIDPFALIDLVSSYGFGKFILRDIAVEAPGVDTMRLGAWTMTDFSLDSLGEFALDDLDVAVPDQGSVKVGRFAFGGLIFPPLQAIIDAARSGESGGNVDYSALVPKLGFVELSGLDTELMDAPDAHLDRFRLDLGRYVGPIPTTVQLDLVGVDVNVDEIDEEEARQTFMALGYERVRMSGGFNVDWSDAGEIDIKEFRFSIAELGSVSGSGVFTGIKPTEIEDLVDEEAAMAKLSFVRGSITFKDDSIVGRGLAMQALKLKTDPVKFREQFAMGLPLMLTFLGDNDLQRQLAPVLQTLIQTSGTITATAEPALPVALAAIAAVGDSAPFALLKMLEVTFSGEKGEGPKPLPPSLLAPPAAPETPPTTDAPPVDAPDAPATEPPATDAPPADTPPADTPTPTEPPAP